MHKIILSSLDHTWILDLDGTIMKHNGYKLDGKDSLLSGALEFLQQIPENDMILFLTSRKEKYKELTETFLKKHNIRFDSIIYNAPLGERILINDNKPSGLEMSKNLCFDRNEELKIKIEIDTTL